jgi:hypothetical protein
MDFELDIIGRLYNHVGALAVFVGVIWMNDGCSIAFIPPYSIYR